MFNVRSWYFSLSALGFALLFYYSPSLQDSAVEGIPRSIYDITVKVNSNPQDVSENEVSLGSYRGKVLLIVNVASKWFKQFMAIKLVLMDKDIALFNPCLGASESYNFLNHYEFYHRTDIALFISGFTHSNYKEMNVLYDKYKDKGLEILAFPCNQFGGQEPGSNEQIQEFTCSRFKSEFPIFDKIEVNGNKAAPLYKFLKSQKGGFLGSQIKWNFTKFLVDKNGNVVGRYAPVTSPLKIEGDIQRLLDA